MHYIEIDTSEILGISSDFFSFVSRSNKNLILKQTVAKFVRQCEISGHCNHEKYKKIYVKKSKCQN